MIISTTFEDADLNLYKKYDWEIMKLIYATTYRFDKLISFLKSKSEYDYLLIKLLTYFKQNSIEKLKEQVCNLLLFTGKYLKEEITTFEVAKENQETISFLDSLTSYNLNNDTDYISLRNYPLYKKEDNTYVIINLFFVLDKFTTSVKFLLKDAFESKNKKTSFFSWFNEEFSEKFLMKNLLDSIFCKRYFVKKQNINTVDNEPDYYIRHKKDIYLFEHKDILINKNIKTSRDFNKIKVELIKKLLIKEDGTSTGIGQLIKHINLISQGKFQFDNEFNKEVNKKYDIYPILLISDRILEVPGVNYILNQYFQDELNKITNINPKLNIKDLIIIDMNTMIFTQHYLTEKDRNFKDRIEWHIKKMTEKRKKNERDSFDKFVKHNILPYGYRFGKDLFKNQSILNKFEKELYLLYKDFLK